MANEVVRYHNDLNLVSMRSWKKNEMDFFFSIISKARDKGCQLLKFDTDELRILCDFKAETISRWKEVLESVQKKVVGMYYWERTENSSCAMTLFSYFKIDYENHSVKLKVSENFEYILNKLNAQFTRFELEEFIGIRSTYAKTMYRLLKQWRTQGEHEWNIEQFKMILGIPESYSNAEVTRVVIKPILKELPQYFPNLKCKPIKKRTQGNPIIAYRFTWVSEVPKKGSTSSWYDHRDNKKSTPEDIERVQKMIDEITK